MQFSEMITSKAPLIQIPDLSWHVDAQQKISYDVLLSRRLLDPANSTFANTCGIDGVMSAKRLIVIDGTVFKLYKEQLKTYFSTWNILPIWKIISGGEASKTMEQTIQVADAMTDAKLLRRTEAVIAIGGGVLLDIVGFAASLYRRGIPYIRIPTTLMGQIDAGIGIKTGVNHHFHKNRLGTYFPPVAALIDPLFLQTLEERHIANGLAEIIKMALIKDNILFKLVEQEATNLNTRSCCSDCPQIQAIFSRAITGMLDELEPNLWEANLERVVDYGHTFSPLLELHAEPMLLHGEAVAIDMAFSIALALHRGFITLSEAKRVLNLIRRVKLPIDHPQFTLELVEQALSDTIKHRDGLQRVPLTVGIGQAVFVNDLTQAELQNALHFIKQIERT